MKYDECQQGKIMSSQLDRLYTQLSELRSKERRGQNIKAEIARVIEEINKLEKPIQQAPVHSPQPQQDRQTSNIDFNARGDVVGAAVGPNASVEAEIIANNYNPQQFSSTTHLHENDSSGPTIYGPHPAHVEVVAGEIVAGWFQRALNAAPQGVSVGLATTLPVLFLFSKDAAILGIIGLLTITPIDVFVLLQTNFLRIPREAYRENKPLYYASWFMTGTGMLTVILFVIGYYLAMATLSAVMGAMREQIYRR